MLALFFAALALSSLPHWVQTGDSAHLVSSVLGIAFGVVLVVGAAVGWRIYWRALARAVRVTREQHPESLVLGARIPDLGPEVVASSWPPRWGVALPPQRLVLRIDSSGVALLNTAVPISSLIELTWDQVKGFAPVEFVEARVAYEGLAIDRLPEGAAIVVQLIIPSVWVRFPRGKALAAIVVRAEGRRPASL